jgi:hypothetical protein
MGFLSVSAFVIGIAVISPLYIVARFPNFPLLFYTGAGIIS